MPKLYNFRSYESLKLQNIPDELINTFVLTHSLWSKKKLDQLKNILDHLYKSTVSKDIINLFFQDFIYYILHSKFECAISEKVEISKFLIKRINKFDWVDVSTGFTVLHSAANEGIVTLVKLIINKGSSCGLNLDSQDFYGFTPLMCATKCSNQDVSPEKYLEIIHELVENGATIDLPNYMNYTPLSTAASYGQLKIVEYLLLKEAAIDVATALDSNSTSSTLDFGFTPLMLAIRNQHTEIAELLISSNSNVNHSSARGNTPLILAISIQNLELMRLLMDKGAILDNTNPYTLSILNNQIINGYLDASKLVLPQLGHYALKIASSAGYEGLLKFLILDGNKDVNFFDFHQDISPFIVLAAKNNNFKIVKFLLDNGANIEAETDSGKTALIWSAINGYYNIVNLLINDYSADTEHKDKKGYNALISILSIEWPKNRIQEYTAIFELILSKTKNINAYNCDGYTALHAAIYKRNVFAIKCLLAIKGIDINFPHHKGYSPVLTVGLFTLQYPTDKCYIEILNLLLDRDDVDVTQSPNNIKSLYDRRGAFESRISNKITSRYKNSRLALSQNIEMIPQPPINSIRSFSCPQTYTDFQFSNTFQLLDTDVDVLNTHCNKKKNRPKKLKRSVSVCREISTFQQTKTEPPSITFSPCTIL